MTQNMTVISGTFAARGCWVKRRIRERTLSGVSLSGRPGRTPGDVVRHVVLRMVAKWSGGSVEAFSDCFSWSDPEFRATTPTSG